SYSDYTRNAMMVIDDKNLEPQLGRLRLEETIYGALPRTVFPDKPKDFGPFWLAKRYFPQRFDSETGAPAFGLGVAYADFGPFAAFYYFAAALATGVMLKLLVARLRQRPDPGTFLLFLVLMDMQLVPTGTVFPLILYYALAHVARSIG